MRAAPRRPSPARRACRGRGEVFGCAGGRASPRAAWARPRVRRTPDAFGRPAADRRGPARAPTPPARGEGRFGAALGRAGPPGCRRAQCAFEDSMARWVPAIRTTYRMSPRSSSTPEPRDPLPGVVLAPPSGSPFPPRRGFAGSPPGGTGENSVKTLHAKGRPRCLRPRAGEGKKRVCRARRPRSPW